MKKYASVRVGFVRKTRLYVKNKGAHIVVNYTRMWCFLYFRQMLFKNCNYFGFVVSNCNPFIKRQKFPQREEGGREVVCTENLLFNRDSIYWSHLMTVSCCINILKSIRVKLSLEFMLTRKQMRFLLWVKGWTLLAKLFLLKKRDLMIRTML